MILVLRLQEVIIMKQKIQDKQGLHSQTRRTKRILLVDDEPDICIVYQIVLQDAGYECKSYTDSVKALQEFRVNYYDLILLDIKMPVLNGFELCKKIREVDRTVHIIFITASDDVCLLVHLVTMTQKQA
jgi:DNA-binding response OmpR family regulator